MESDQKRSSLLLLCLFLGWFGGHRFYLKKYKSGFLQLLSLGLAGIWTVTDFIYIACGCFKDAQGRLITKW